MLRRCLRNISGHLSLKCCVCMCKRPQVVALEILFLSPNLTCILKLSQHNESRIWLQDVTPYKAVVNVL